MNFFKKHREIILYFICGGITTLINIIVFYILDSLNVYLAVSNTLAWFLSILWAFFANKFFVFRSNDKSKKTLLKEVPTFLFLRVLTLLIDTGLMYLFIKLLTIDSLISKIVVNVIIVILNYIFNKFLVFRKR